MSQTAQNNNNSLVQLQLYALVVKEFKGDASVSQLSLHIGEVVSIRGEFGANKSTWCFGSIYSAKDKRGFFPAECVCIFDKQNVVRTASQIFKTTQDTSQLDHKAFCDLISNVLFSYANIIEKAKFWDDVQNKDLAYIFEVVSEWRCKIDELVQVRVTLKIFFI